MVYLATQRQPKGVPNRRKITQLFVDSVKSETKRTRIWDTNAPGLVLQVEPSGSKAFYLYYRRNNRARWHRLGTAGSLSLGDARSAVRHISAKLTLDPAYDPQVEKNAARMQGTVAELVARYKAEHLANLKAPARPKYLLDRFVVASIGNLPASSVQRADVRRLLDRITKPSMRQQTHANISAMFGWAMRKEIVSLPGNPAAGIERVKLPARERVLSNREIPLFWHALDEFGLTPARALRLILLTGQRPGEVRHMRWADIDVGKHQFTDNNGNDYVTDGAWWTLNGQPSGDGTWPGTKNEHTHKVWLSAPALSIIDEIEEERRTGSASPYVIEGQGSEPMKGFDKPMRHLCSELEFEKSDKVTPHDLRRTHGTTVTSLGFGREAMNRIQNHVEGGIASVYDRHGYQHEARKIQEAVADRLIALVHEQSGSNIVAKAR